MDLRCAKKISHVLASVIPASGSARISARAASNVHLCLPACPLHYAFTASPFVKPLSSPDSHLLDICIPTEALFTLAPAISVSIAITIFLDPLDRSCYEEF